MLPSQDSGSQSPSAAAISFESYGRLLTLLLPRMRNLAVHDGFANPIWSSPDWNIDNVADLVRQTISAALQEEAEIPALGHVIDNDRALYTFALRSDAHEILAVVSLEVAIPGNLSAPRPVQTLRPFVQPAIECLKRELVLRDALGARGPQGAPRAQVVPLPFGSVGEIEALDAILRNSFEYIGCALAALWIPGRNVSLSLTPSGNRMSPQLLRVPQLQLTETMQQHPRTIVVNQCTPAPGSTAVAYKIIACPVSQPAGHTAGVLALFNPPSVADFNAHQARAAELLASASPCCSVAAGSRGRGAPAGTRTPDRLGSRAAIRIQSRVHSRRRILSIMTIAATHAPELSAQSWFNVDNEILLAGLRGRVVVLSAFQVLCPNSVSYGVPQTLRIHQTFDPKEVAVIGLHATFEHHDAVTPAVIKAFIQEYRLKFPVALDRPGKAGPIPQTMDRYQMRGTPSLVLIDRQGMIRKHAFGPVDDLRIGAEIGALIQPAHAVQAAHAVRAPKGIESALSTPGSHP